MVEGGDPAGRDCRMKMKTQKKTFAGKALNVALAAVLAIGLMPPIHAFGEEASGGGSAL